MSIPEQLNDEQAQQSSEHAPLRADDEVMEIGNTVLEHVAGGCSGGGGTGDN